MHRGHAVFLIRITALIAGTRFGNALHLLPLLELSASHTTQNPSHIQVLWPNHFVPLPVSNFNSVLRWTHHGNEKDFPYGPTTFLYGTLPTFDVGPQMSRDSGLLSSRPHIGNSHNFKDTMQRVYPKPFRTNKQSSPTSGGTDRHSHMHDQELVVAQLPTEPDEMFPITKPMRVTSTYFADSRPRSLSSMYHTPKQTHHRVTQPDPPTDTGYTTHPRTGKGREGFHLERYKQVPKRVFLQSFVEQFGKLPRNLHPVLNASGRGRHFTHRPPRGDRQVAGHGSFLRHTSTSQRGIRPAPLATRPWDHVSEGSNLKESEAHHPNSHEDDNDFMPSQYVIDLKFRKSSNLNGRSPAEMRSKGFTETHHRLVERFEEIHQHGDDHDDEGKHGTKEHYHKEGHHDSRNQGSSSYGNFHDDNHLRHRVRGIHKGHHSDGASKRWHSGGHHAKYAGQGSSPHRRIVPVPQDEGERVIPPVTFGKPPIEVKTLLDGRGSSRGPPLTVVYREPHSEDVHPPIPSKDFRVNESFRNWVNANV